MFFNGQNLITPQVRSAIDTTALSNNQVGAGNTLAIIGQSTGGAFGVPVTYATPSDARATLLSGELLTAVEKAFDPSAQTGAPNKVVGIRSKRYWSASGVAPAASTHFQVSIPPIYTGINGAISAPDLMLAGIELYDENDAVIDLTGATITCSPMALGGNGGVNDVEFILSGGTIQSATSGAKTPKQVLTDGSDLTGITWVGYLTVTITVVLASARIVKGYGLQSFNATVLSLPGIQNNAGLFTPSIWTANTSTDGVAWTAIHAISYTTPWVDGHWERFTTGTSTTAIADWSTILETLQAEDVQWVVPLSADLAVHSMVSTHCTYMSGTAKAERRGLVGLAVGATGPDALAAATALGDTRMSVVFPGYYDYDASGALTLRPGYMTAALIAAGFSGSAPGTAMTNKSVKTQGLEQVVMNTTTGRVGKIRNPSDTDTLITGGVLCMEQRSDGTTRCVKSISTWVQDTNFYNVEVSVGAGYDYLSRLVRAAIDPLIGQMVSPSLLGQYVSRTDGVCRDLAIPAPFGPGLLVGDAVSPPYRSITATANGDAVQLSFQASVGIPNNYGLIVIHAVPYSGTATA